MAPKFGIPKNLDDLMQNDSGGEQDNIYAQDVIDIDTLNVTEIHRLIAGLASELAEKDLLCVLEQPVFDQLFSLIRGYSYLEASSKSILLDSLCTNFVQLNVSTSVLTKSMQSSEDDREEVEDVAQQCRAHCSAIKIYTYFILCIINVEEAEAEGGPPESRDGTVKGSKGRPRKKHVPQDWEWSSFRIRCLRVIAGALNNDLQLIFESRHLDESLISILARAAFKMLEKKSVMDKDDSKLPLCDIISACTVKYGHRVSAVVTLIDMLHRFEHLAKHVADLVSRAESQYNGSSFAVDLLRAVGQIDPKNFERDNAGAENVGLFLEELATRLPKIVITNLSLILGHMEGKSYKMRNSLIKVIGALLIGALKASDGISSSDVTRIRNEQALLSVLIERCRDVSAHTRKHVLQTWANLCKEHAVPIGHWNLVSDLAAGRLEDSAAVVRKSALQLLATLLEYNPFGPSLRTAAFEATFEKYSEKLEKMSQPDLAGRERSNQGQTAEEAALNGEHRSEDDLESQMDQPSALEGGKGAGSQPEGGPTVSDSKIPELEFSTEIGGLEQTRALVASLESALRFSKCIGSTMDTLSQLLASSTVTDVECTLKLLILCKKFEVDGAGACLRKALPLIFSREERVTVVVEEAFKTLYLTGSPSELALNLIKLTLEASLGDLASIEALISKSMAHHDIQPGTVSALWDFFTFNAPGSTADRSRGALAVLCMAAKSNPHILSSHLQNILDIGFGRRARDDVLLARYACIALQRLPEASKVGFKRGHKVFSILANLIIGPGLSEACWYSAVEQSINVIYALHPAPESLVAGLLVTLSQSVFSSGTGLKTTNPGPTGEDFVGQSLDVSSVSLVAASRFLFVVSEVALKHLVYIESCLKRVRKLRADAEKPVARDPPEVLDPDQVAEDPKEESIATELGLAASEDAQLDELAEQTEKELVGNERDHKFLIGTIAPMVTRLCLNSHLMRKYQRLQSSAMLALCKLMIIDPSFCERHLQLVFSIAQNSPEDSVRSNCIIAFGDLALRFPNLLEPWMESIYARVHDISSSVRKNTVLVLSHLILNDLIKVKGYISEMAIHLVDEDLRISDLVKLCFQELSKKGSNPINSLLPEILSRLSINSALSQEQFNIIMQFLIATIKKTSQMEGLIEKFCTRFEGNADTRSWQDISFCLCQLSYSPGCLRKLADHFKLYQHALGDVVVIENFKALISKTKKLAAADLKLLLDEFEEKVMSGHKEKSEQDAACRKAQEHRQQAKAVRTEGSSGAIPGEVQEDDVERNIGEDCGVTSREASSSVHSGGSTELPPATFSREETRSCGDATSSCSIVEDDNCVTSSVKPKGIGCNAVDTENGDDKSDEGEGRVEENGNLPTSHARRLGNQRRTAAACEDPHFEDSEGVLDSGMLDEESGGSGTQPYPYMDLDLGNEMSDDDANPRIRAAVSSRAIGALPRGSDQNDTEDTPGYAPQVLVATSSSHHPNVKIEIKQEIEDFEPGRETLHSHPRRRRKKKSSANSTPGQRPLEQERDSQRATPSRKAHENGATSGRSSQQGRNVSRARVLKPRNVPEAKTSSESILE